MRLASFRTGVVFQRLVGAICIYPAANQHQPEPRGRQRARKRSKLSISLSKAIQLHSIELLSLLSLLQLALLLLLSTQTMNECPGLMRIVGPLEFDGVGPMSVLMNIMYSTTGAPNSAHHHYSRQLLLAPPMSYLSMVACSFNSYPLMHSTGSKEVEIGPGRPVQASIEVRFGGAERPNRNSIGLERCRPLCKWHTSGSFIEMEAPS